jgi:hypothetical protein
VLRQLDDTSLMKLMLALRRSYAVEHIVSAMLCTMGMRLVEFDFDRLWSEQSDPPVTKSVFALRHLYNQIDRVRCVLYNGWWTSSDRSSHLL